MERDKTTIWVKNETWKKLNGMKGVGDSFDDVIQRLLEYKEEAEDD